MTHGACAAAASGARPPEPQRARASPEFSPRAHPSAASSVSCQALTGIVRTDRSSRACATSMRFLATF